MEFDLFFSILNNADNFEQIPVSFEETALIDLISW